ncbi:MAG: NADH-quinone oxidoreductase subunit J [Acidobacteriota bacterium]
MVFAIFYIFAAVAVISALCVVVQRRPVYGALALIVCLGSIAVLFFQLGAHFIATVQVIVYAGAIMVLFLFVIMLLDPQSEIFSANHLKKLTLLAPVVGIFLAFLLLRALPRINVPALMGGAATPQIEGTRQLARQLFKDYLLPFEVTSVLILVAVVGAVVLAKRPD